MSRYFRFEATFLKEVLQHQRIVLLIIYDQYLGHIM